MNGSFFMPPHCRQHVALDDSFIDASQVVLMLQAHPIPRRSPEESRQARRGIG